MQVFFLFCVKYTDAKIKKNMTCKQISNLLWDYTLDILPESIKKQVKIHLDQCSDCKKELIIIKTITQQVNNEKNQINNNDLIFTNSVLNNLKTQKPKKVPQIIKLKKVFEYSIAASILIIGVTFGVWLGKGFEKTNTVAQNNNVDFEDNYISEYIKYDQTLEAIWWEDDEIKDIEPIYNKNKSYNTDSF